jgi:hypothetical protein
MVNKEERRWLIIAGVVILAVTGIPYLAGYFQQGTDWRFTGFLFGLEDGNSYIAKMLTGTYGSWLFRSPYSAMPQKGVLAFVPYILLGKLAFPPEAHDQLVVLFQLFRWVAGGILIWATYAFCSLFIENRKNRQLATLVILLGGGLGWTSLLIYGANVGWGGSLEIYSPEAFGFLSILGLPHLAAARGLLLFGLIYFLRQNVEDMWKMDAIKGGFCWLAIGFFQPLTIVIGYGILGCYMVIRLLAAGKKEWKTILPLVYKAAVMAGISSPWVIYNFAFFNTDAYLKIWYQQNIISSPPVLDYLLSFGLFFLLGLPALWHIFRTRKLEAAILPAWVLCAVILAYIPYNLQRRFIDGVWVVLVILMFMAMPLIRNKWLRKLSSIAVGTTFIAPVLVMMIMSIGVIKPAEPVFRPVGEIKMYTAMEPMVNPGDIVLTGYKTGNVLPAWVPVRVVAGHGPETANLKTVLPDVQAFFSGERDVNWQREFLKENNVSFIVSGPDDKKFGNWKADSDLKLETVYTNGSYQVYGVEHYYGK